MTINGKNIAHATSLSIGEAEEFFEALNLNETEQTIANLILKEIRARLGFLVNVGLDYLTMQPCSRHIVWWGGAADPIGYTNRFQPDGRAVYSG